MGANDGLGREQAIDIANAAFRAGMGRSLKDLEVALLRGAYDGLTYPKMAEQLGYTEKYLRQDVGHTLWQDLSKCLGERVSKTSFIEALQRWQGQQRQQNLPALGSLPPPELPASGSPQIDLALQQALLDLDVSVPDISQFYGRSAECEQIAQRLLAPCRLVTIYGVRGIGKTFLAAKVVLETVQDSFQVVIWRSLSHGKWLDRPPLLRELLQDLIQVFDPQATQAEIPQLLQHLQRSPCLLVLDGWEAVLEPGTHLGSYRSDYRDYSHFLQQLMTTAHQSRILLTSGEKPREVELKESEYGAVYAVRLEGWRERSLKQYLADRGITQVSDAQVRSLLNGYGGHPVILERVAAYIRGAFNGDVEHFLAQDVGQLFGDLPHLVAQQLQPISPLERSFLQSISQLPQPISLQDILQSVVSCELSTPFHELLQSLQRRAIVVQVKYNTSRDQYYSLPPFVTQYLLRYQ